MAPRIPCQLPPAAEQFFGRQEQLAKLEQRLRAGKSTAVVGPAGMGKTALAAEALNRVVDEGGSKLAASPYPDGIVFLDLYVWGGQAEPAWNTLASTLAGPDFLPQSPARERATEACRGRRMLLVIEGGEEATGADGRTRIEDLFGVLSPENRWLLLTRDSRQANPAESVTVREALGADDAAKLLDAPSDATLAGKLREKVLDLLAGHPLALTWAGNLLARGDEPVARLVADWENDPLLGLADPKKAEHSLAWLYERSTRDLDESARQALEAAGLLAHAPFPLAMIEAMLPTGTALAALQELVQRGLLRVLLGEDRWQFTHVLGYRFARREEGPIRSCAKIWLPASEISSPSRSRPAATSAPVAETLDHAAALLRTDPDQQLWSQLTKELLYGLGDRLVALGRLPSVNGPGSRCAAGSSEHPSGTPTITNGSASSACF